MKGSIVSETGIREDRVKEVQGLVDQGTYNRPENADVIDQIVVDRMMLVIKEGEKK